MDAGRGSALKRTLTVLMLIMQRPRTLNELAKETAVSNRTARRDLEVLEAVGFPLTVDYADTPASEGRWSCLQTKLIERLLKSAALAGETTTEVVTSQGEDGASA